MCNCPHHRICSIATDCFIHVFCLGFSQEFLAEIHANELLVWQAKSAVGDASGTAKDVAGDAKGAAKSASGDAQQAAKKAAGSVNEASGNLSANPLDDAIGKVSSSSPKHPLFLNVFSRES